MRCSRNGGKMVKLLRLCLVIGSIFFATAQAAPVLIVDSNGILTGATGVEVAGLLFDVQFVDGTCGSVYTDCGLGTLFPIPSPADARIASQALLDQVFIDGNVGVFDTYPNLTTGCERGFQCLVLTPYRVEPPPPLSLDLIVDTWTAFNTCSFSNLFSCGTPPDQISQAPFAVLPGFDTTIVSARSVEYVWALWTPHAVPEPGTTTCLGAALLAFVLTQRRRPQRQVRIQ
jgi:hypothetical protein